MAIQEPAARTASAGKRAPMRIGLGKVAVKRAVLAFIGGDQGDGVTGCAGRESTAFPPVTTGTPLTTRVVRSSAVKTTL